MNPNHRRCEGEGGETALAKYGPVKRWLAAQSLPTNNVSPSLPLRWPNVIVRAPVISSCLPKPEFQVFPEQKACKGCCWLCLFFSLFFCECRFPDRASAKPHTCPNKAAIVVVFYVVVFVADVYRHVFC